MLAAGLLNSKHGGPYWKKFVISLGSHRGTLVRDQCKVDWKQEHTGDPACPDRHMLG